MREKHLQLMQARAKLYAKQNALKATDYKALKYSEGLFTEAEYAPIKAERQALRNRINELKTTITTVTEEIKNA